MAGCQELIDELWDFADAAASEGRLRAAHGRAEEAGDEFAAIELRTQIARALGLQRRFAEAHAELDAVERAVAAAEAAGGPTSPSAHNCTNVELWNMRLRLERGRVLNSSGRGAEALPLFAEAWGRARGTGGAGGPGGAGLDSLAIDAAHMIAIVHGAQDRPDQAMEWNLTALALAEASDQARARQWRGSLHNNIGWTLHDQGRFAEALAHFEQALACRVEQGNPGDVSVARWCIARCLRSLGRIEEALTMQRALADERQAAGQPDDGYVPEEIGECLLALGRAEEARPHFRRACELLTQDASLREREAQRLERLRRLAHP